MSRLYPKSFLRLILIGFGLVSLPLVFALGNAAFNVQHLAEQSERAVREAAVATRASREMLETLTGMERALRQYQVLRERGLLEDYRRLRGEFVQATQEYSRLPLDEGGREGQVQGRLPAQTFAQVDPWAARAKLAALEDDHAVGQGQDLREPVRGEERRLALRLELQEERHERRARRRIEVRRGLVGENDVGP